MAYSLRYRKSRDTKGWDLTPAVFESHDDNYGYNSIYMVNETGYKKYRPRYYRMDILQSKAEIALLSFVTVLALATRTWMVNSIDTSVLGEFNTSYGVNQYLNRKFFIDQNPPLATMIYTFAAWCFGYRGQQRMMYMGQPFANFPYVQLRMISATLGALQVPIAYLTLKLMGHKSLTALVAATLLIFENGAISQHRHILNTSMFGFFVSSSIMMWVNFHNHQNNPYSFKWWTWQTLAGACIGCAMSTSWKGVLLLPLFWTSNARQIWCLLGDPLNPITSIVKEVSSRIWSMVIVPLGVYLLCFQAHFSMIHGSGDHDLLLSPELRSSFNVFRTGSSQTDVAYGSKVYLRHLNSHVGYLHSHEYSWIDGSKQQQVTGYPYEDLNNGWIFQKQESLWNGTQPIEWVEDNQKVRLEHFSTLRKLHSHDKYAPISQELFEVTAYGDIYSQDPNDVWTVEIVGHDPEDVTSKERLRVLSTKFRLKHSRGCYLSASEVKLPEYAKGHFEVACKKEAKMHASTWVVENAIHPKLKMVDTDHVSYKRASFYEKMVEVHGIMRNYDKVIPEVEPVNIEVTLPHQWFLQGETMQIWSEELAMQIVTSLNPFVSWIGCTVTAFYLLFSVLNSLLSKRGIQWSTFTRSQGGSEWRAFQTIPSKEFYLQSFGFLFAAVGCSTVLVYALPFNTTLADSLLGVYFLVLSTAVAFEVTTIRLPFGFRIFCFIAVLMISAYCFMGLIPTTYGKTWTRVECEKSSLKFDCQLYPAVPIGSQSQQEQQTVYVDIFGDTYLIDYVPGEEAKVGREARNMKLDIWESKTRGTKVKERYIGVKSTPAPKYSDVKSRRIEFYNDMTNRYLASHPTEHVDSVMKEENTGHMDAPELMNGRQSDPEQKEAVDEAQPDDEILSKYIQRQTSENPHVAEDNHENSQTQVQVDDSPQTPVAVPQERRQKLRTEGDGISSQAQGGMAGETQSSDEVDHPPAQTEDAQVLHQIISEGQHKQSQEAKQVWEAQQQAKQAQEAQNAQEEQQAREAQKAEESQRDQEEQQAREAQQAQEVQRVQEEKEALEARLVQEQKALESQQAQEEQHTHEARRLQEQKALETEQVQEEQQAREAQQTHEKQTLEAQQAQNEQQFWEAQQDDSSQQQRQEFIQLHQQAGQIND